MRKQTAAKIFFIKRKTNREQSLFSVLDKKGFVISAKSYEQ